MTNGLETETDAIEREIECAIEADLRRLAAGVVEMLPADLDQARKVLEFADRILHLPAPAPGGPIGGPVTPNAGGRVGDSGEAGKDRLRPPWPSLEAALARSEAIF